MYKIIIASFLFLFFSCKSPENNINVDIKGVADGKKVWLKKQLDDGKVIVIDSTIVKDQKFGFYKKIEEPIIYGIFIDSIKGGIYPLIDIQDKISIIAYKDSLTKSKVTGSKLYDDLTRLRIFRDQNIKQIRKLRRSLKLLHPKDTAAFSALRSKIYSFSNQIFVNDWKYANKNPNSVVSVMVLSKMNLNPFSMDSLKNTFDKLNENVKNSMYAKQIKKKFENIEKMPPMPNLKKSKTN